MTLPATDPFTTWLAALEARHLANLRIAEVTRALRALSSAYVERRHRLATGAALDTAGKRAAFALFYGPLHYLTTAAVLQALDAAPPPGPLLDLGCGTGAAGAAWAGRGGARAPVHGIDRHPWAVTEARWTYAHFGLPGRASIGDVTRIPRLRPASGVIAAYLLNELPDTTRAATEQRLLAAARQGVSILVLEPIARRVAPWWDDVAQRFANEGGRADEWRFTLPLPPLVRLLDQATGLDHRTVSVRSLAVNVGR